MYPFKEVEYKKYISELDVAKDICNRLLGEPRTAKEIADRYNQVGNVIRIILEEKDEESR